VGTAASKPACGNFVETIGLCAVLGLIGFFLRNVAAMSILGLGTLYAIYTSTAQVLPTSELGSRVFG